MRLTHQKKRRSPLAEYLLILSTAVALAGAWPSASQAVPPAGAGSNANQFGHVLLALAVVIVVGRLCGRALSAIGQPPVIGEVLGGIFIGPSLLGRIAPGVSAFILPDSVAPMLGVIAQLGGALYMFLVGLTLDIDRVRRSARSVIAISSAGMISPFMLGAVLAVYLFPRFAPTAVTFTSFALFISVAMSITAFPVLARILTDNRMSQTDLGMLALTCAAAGDVTAWCLLAFVVGVTRSAASDGLIVLALTIGFVLAMFLAVRPLVASLSARMDDGPPKRSAIATTMVSLLLSMLVAEMIGLHAIFGAFLLGTIIPHDSSISRALTARMEDVVTILLLPAFFALTGMRTEIGLVSGAGAWMTVLLIIAVATLGKFGGSALAARLTGRSWRQATILGALMNTRGLMELIVLNIGLELGVISPTLFTMMVLMALTTTLMAGPFMRLARPGFP